MKREFSTQSKTRRQTLESSMASARSFVDEQRSSIADARVVPEIGFVWLLNSVARALRRPIPSVFFFYDKPRLADNSVLAAFLGNAFYFYANI
jgi:hypothetical protein